MRVQILKLLVRNKPISCISLIQGNLNMFEVEGELLQLFVKKKLFLLQISYGIQY